MKFQYHQRKQFNNFMSIISPKAIIIPFPLLAILNLSLASNAILDNHTNLIFHHCSSQKLDNPNETFANARTRLLQKLVTQSHRSKFGRTFVMVGDGDHYSSSLSGLFQCRGDLDDNKCNECIKAIPNISYGLCDESMAARIQLSGCHVQYEVEGYDNSTPNDKLKHKTCGKPQGVISKGQFGEMRSQAFEALEEAVVDEGSIGFYSINHEGIHAMAQCEVGIGACDCGNCVVHAVHVIEEECESSIFGQVFMDLCSLSFEFNPHGLHGDGDFNPEKKGGSSPGKIVAIGIGGAVFLVMAFVFLRFCERKNDD